ncbi:MAG: membrane-bound lytic murein transglycosylase B, partial [Pseudohongiellaceae bacterium]
MMLLEKTMMLSGRLLTMLIKILQKKYFKVALSSWALSAAVFAQANYQDHEKAKAFVTEMVKDHGFEQAYVESLVKNAERKQSILDAISRPAEKTKTWGDYRKIFLGEARVNQGKQFIVEHKATLERAEKEFGVPRHIIAAIIGVETRYGRHQGRYRVLDALATLAFDYPPRSKFFTSELQQYLLLVKEQGFDAQEVMGSYAGAMGFGQFISSSYRHYAIDFDDDGVVDIVSNPVDAIGSVANYFKKHGWRSGETVTVKAALTDKTDRAIANQKLKPVLAFEQVEAAGFQASLAKKDL